MITSKQARSITNENLRGPVIESFVSTLVVKIKMEAAKGRSSINPWTYLAAYTPKSPDASQKEAIRKHFEQAGFDWIDHADPDPGHPASGPYTILSW